MAEPETEKEEPKKEDTKKDTSEKKEEEAPKEEIREVVKKNSGEILTDEELCLMMKGITGKEDAEMSWEEFIQLMTAYKSEESELRASFNRFDKDGDGEISPGELQEVMHACGEKLSLDEVKQ